jgi:tetratricopeptide (TPR) repeat protein
MTDFEEGLANAAPSNFNIFTHSLKQEFTSIYDGVRQALPSISVDDLSDSDGSQGEAEPIVFSHIDHEKTMQAMSELSRPIVRGQSRQKIDAKDRDKINSSLSDDEDSGSAALHNSASDMVNAAMQRRPAAADGGSAAPQVRASAVGGEQSSRAVFNSMQASGSFDRHRARVEEHTKLQSGSTALSARSADRDAQYSVELETRARAHIDNHNYLEADDDLTFRISVAEPAPGASVYSMRGFCRRMLGQYDEALRDFATALELDEDDQRAFHEYRRLSRMLKETKAQHSAKGQVALEPDAALFDKDNEAFVEEQFWKDVRQASSPSAILGFVAPKDSFSLDLQLDGIDLDGLLAQVQPAISSCLFPVVTLHDAMCSAWPSKSSQPSESLILIATMLIPSSPCALRKTATVAAPAAQAARPRPEN